MFHWLPFLTYAAVTAATPGPNNLISLSLGIRHGLRKALRFQGGLWAGFSLASLLCMAFCSLLTAVLPRLELPLRLAGAAYMLYLAWKTFTAPPRAEGQSAECTFLSGFVLQFVNPKLYVYCIVSMETYILPYFQGNWAALAGFALLLAFIGLCCNLCWAAFGSTFQALFSRYARITNTALGGLLLYCAATLFF